MKNICNFYLTYKNFSCKQKYLHQVSIYIFKKASLDIAKNLLVHLIKIKHNEIMYNIL